MVEFDWIQNLYWPNLILFKSNSTKFILKIYQFVRNFQQKSIINSTKFGLNIFEKKRKFSKNAKIQIVNIRKSLEFRRTDSVSVDSNVYKFSWIENLM